MSFGFAVESPRAEPALPLRYTGGHLMAIANWKNQTIWTGDNLDIMRGMNSESVDLIYLDPPFNSNRTYSAPIGSKAAGAAFKDAWTLDDVDIAWIGLIAEKEPSLPPVIDAAGVSHGKGMKAYLVMMAVRLLEMRRLLKATGTIYLHCDPTASHYLKLVMDCVFGPQNFRNEITWQRTHSHGNVGRSFGSVCDTIFMYTKADKYTWQQQYVPFSQQYAEKTFKHSDADGRRWQSVTLRNPGVRPNLHYPYRASNGVTYWPHPNGWSCDSERLKKYDRENRLHFPKNQDGALRLKMYLDESRGVRVQNLWSDIPVIGSRSAERLGYPTQKPLKLLDRIIEASSNEGDVVLDPFCGCATTCVAAHALGRLWTGIDISSKAAELIVQRLQQDYKGAQVTWMTQATKVIHRDKPPQRTDVGKLPPYKTHKHTLYGMQEGRCKGCGHHFPFQNFTVDHIVARSKGGTDHLENLQLLCNHCNSVKGTMDQAAFTAKLKNMGLGA